MNLAVWLERAAKARGHLPAVALGKKVTHTYRRLADRAARLGGGLRAIGVRPGDRVAIVSGNSAEYVEALYGIWWCGAVALPVNEKLSGAEIAWILENASATVALVSEGIDAEIPAGGTGGLRELVVLGTPAYKALFRAGPVPLAERAPEDFAWLFYTSGTTGRPKGAMLSHRNLAVMTFAYLSDVDPVAPGDGLLHAAPMSHGSGLYIMAHVARCAVNVVPESGRFDPLEIAEAFTARPSMSIFAVPTMVKRLVASSADFDPSTIRTIVYGGAPMHVVDAVAALDRFGPRLAQIYGQGETPMTATVLSKADIAARDHPRWLERLGSAGIASSAVEVRVAGSDDEPLSPGSPGEVLVRGDTVMSGYWENPAATAATLRGGWLHTGDIGAFDDEGYLTLKDRSKDVIICGGSNIYPREVEEVLLAHPGVRETSVIGRPDAEWGEIVVAYVVGEADRASLDRTCLERIARFKRPRDYVFVPELPKNNYGKILKTAIKKMDAGRGDETPGARSGATGDGA